MEKLKEAVYTALRDDSTATVGLRTLLGHAATPYGVYFAYLPEKPDFSSKHYLTYMLLAQAAEPGVGGTDMRLRQAVFSVTAWSSSDITKEQILRRIENVLEQMRKVTKPTSQCELHDLRFESSGPDLFDDEFKVHHRSVQYRAYYRDDITT